MVWEDVKARPCWCIHFWDMSLYAGEVLGKEKEKDEWYVRLEGDAINDIKIMPSKNIFYTEKEAEKALFKANLAGKKREPNWKK
jgi:hypothetical protein